MSNKPRSVNGLLTSVDSLFTTQAERDDELKPKVEEIFLDLIDGFEGHPFSVKDDEDMQNLVKSISENGVLVPCIARQNGERYELISGHRRKAACEILGIATLPIIIKDMTREEAIITMVDSNIQREHILPSEKAFAYKMKLDAMKHQGWRSDLTSPQVVAKSRTTEMVGADTGDSHEQVRRYIRLTNLIPEILQYVDEGRISFTPAVELSYLNEQEQYDLLEQMEINVALPEELLNSFAKALVPEIRAFYDSDEGKAYFEKWLTKHPEYDERIPDAPASGVSVSVQSTSRDK